MQRKIKWICFIIGAVLVLGALIAAIVHFGNRSGGQAYFQAVVQEISEKQILVTPLEGSSELNSSDLIWITKKVVSAEGIPDIQEGDTIQIVYDGLIQETYPAQISTVFAIYLVKEGEAVPNETEGSETVTTEKK